MTLWKSWVARSRSMSARLLFFLTLALLPLGLVAVFQTISVIEEAYKLRQRNILAQTADAASAEFGLIRRAHGAGHALGAVAAELDPATEDCSAVMRAFVDKSDSFIFAGFIRSDGQMRCSSTAEPFDFSGNPNWERFLENPIPVITISRKGALSQESVVVSTVPVKNSNGELLGGVSVSIPHSLSDTLLLTGIRGLDLALIDAEGEVIAASTGIDDHDMFEMLRLRPRDMVIGRDGVTLDHETPEGEEKLVAVVPLAGTKLFAMGIWSETAQPQLVSLLGTATPAFPVLMWLASLFVAFFAMDRLVLRHLKILRRRMLGFSPENRVESYVRLGAAPKEIVEIAESYNNMIDKIAADHAALEANVREKEVLLKEVHHRVKNNLQLIASILNMQLRTISSEDAKRVLRRVQDRVLSLATIHKSLYTDARIDSVRADSLLDELVRGLCKIGTSSQATIRTEMNLSRVVLDPDQAVPLSLLVTEAVTNAVKHAGISEDGTINLQVRLQEDDNGTVHLRIANSRGKRIEPEDSQDVSGLGSRLIEAFVSQLGGTLEIEETDASYAIDVTFVKFEV